jgi:hypothetical protein
VIVDFKRKGRYRPHLAMFAGVYDTGNVWNSDTCLSDVGRCEGAMSNDAWLRGVDANKNL